MDKKEYAELLKDPRWTDKRNEILYRDWHTCTKCMSNKNLHVHHKFYREGLKPWEYESANLVTLCSKCHTEEHGLENESDDFWVIKGRIIGSAALGVAAMRELEFQKWLKEQQDGEKIQ